MSSKFNEYASDYDAWFLENENVLYSEVKLVAHFLKDAGEVFSVGCGSGLFENILKKEFGILVKNGIEPSKEMAAIARKRGLKVSITTAEEMELEKENYDTILFNGTPSYITDLQKALNKAYEALRLGGKLVVIDVPKESSYGVLYNLAKAVGSWDHELLGGVQPRDPYPIDLVKVANWRTTAEKIKMIKNANFKNLQFAQTLTKHPLYSNALAEEPIEGYDCGDYVAICATKN
ncbi:class I SAM-dependent DNA methyltransferase [Marinifilum sp. RC60d5]|uniref:class I SAM-dependent DNA methyltransferase n=1 Tax=Marinifilum sp. RC60d5 TaxID=3458414 RepID=UPI00403597F6